MTKKHVEISEYADELISVPRARVMLELAQVESGVTLTHEGRMLVSCRHDERRDGGERVHGEGVWA